MRVPFGQALFTVFGEMILPKALMGRLEPEEWRPLIASSLIFRGKLQVKSSLLATTRMLLPAVPVMIAAILVLPALGEKPPLSIVLTAVVGLISSYLALAILAWSSSIRYMKRVVMKADTLAAEHVDKERFLEVLKKIDSLGLEEKGLRTRLYPRPTIRERIRNLESYVEQRHGV